MKIKHLFGLAVIAAMTASCSSNEDLGTAGSGTGTNEAGVSYATFTINLPSTNGTRAANDDFAEGTASEYAVNDATLLIFQKDGKSENEYKYIETAKLGNLDPWKNDNTTGITTESTTITAKLEHATVGDGKNCDYYALVILNNEVGTENKVTLPTGTTTYGAWNVASNATATNLVNNKEGFYMANAPRFTDADVEPTTLVKIEGIYRTKEEAQSKPGTTVYVERGLAKVTVGSSTTEGSKDYFAKDGASATGTKYSNDNVKITNWALDVTNNSSFPVHVTSGLKAGITPTNPTDQKVPAYAEIWSNTAATSGTAPATSRFVSHADAFKRVYWGIDPNYSKNLTDKAACEKEFTLVKADGSDAVWKTSTDPLYCLENTFDISHMKQGQTTRVLLKATYTPNVLEKETDKTFFMIGNSSDFWTETTLTEQIKSKAEEVLNTKTGVTVTLKDDLLKGGTHVLDANTVEIKEGTEDKTAVVAGQINTKLGLDMSKGIGIKTYKNGESYYIARIKHFGDDLTPWKEGDATYGENTYGENNLNWLGRYGVLRNNWYDLTINKISGPGYPDVPEVKPTDPDDEDTKYISVSVKILSWAKRSQGVEL